MKVSISPDFRDLLPEHTPDELEQLEKNCRDDPRHERMPPVIVWGNHHNTIIDGHHQHAIRERHGLAIRYSAKAFDSRDEALTYALNVQMGRRNLGPSQRAILATRYPRFAHGGDRRSHDQGANLPLDALAKAAGISERLMKSAAKVADQGTAAVVDGVCAGDFSASDAATIVNLPEHEQNAIAEAAKSNGTTLKDAKISGGITFDPIELENAPPRKPPKNGSSVIPGKEKEVALQLISSLCRVMKLLDLFDKHNLQLSEMIRDVKALR